MKVRMKVATLASIMMAALLTPAAAQGQHKHQQAGQSKPGMKSEMATMMQSPHHQLMMAYLRSMADFASTLRDQAVKPAPLDAEFARATVAELRHSLDAMESLHQKHMGMMNAEMQAKMQTMRERMGQHRSNPVCASCHNMIDPAGFALEQFDAVKVLSRLCADAGV